MYMYIKEKLPIIYFVDTTMTISEYTSTLYRGNKVTKLPDFLKIHIQGIYNLLR